MAPSCDFCKGSQGGPCFLPPDMVDEPFEEGEHKGKRMCHFCKYKTDVLVGTDGTRYVKAEVEADYRKFCDEVYQNPEIYTKFNKAMVDSAVAKMANKNS